MIIWTKYTVTSKFCETGDYIYISLDEPLDRRGSYTHDDTRSRDVTRKRRHRWMQLADVTFDWRHVIVTAVERNNQTRRIITFFAAYLQDLNQNSTNNEQSENIRDEFNFSEVHGSMNAAGPMQSWRDALRVSLTLCSYFHEPQKNEIYFLNKLCQVRWQH